MHQDLSQPPKPLVASLGAIDKPNKTYFYARPDGTPFCVEAKEAWTIHRKFKQIGVSDGSIYYEGVKESHQIFKEKGLEAAQARIRKGFADELEAARGKFETPPNVDRMEFIHRS